MNLYNLSLKKNTSQRSYKPKDAKLECASQSRGDFFLHTQILDPHLIYLE